MNPFVVTALGEVPGPCGSPYPEYILSWVFHIAIYSTLHIPEIFPISVYPEIYPISVYYDLLQVTGCHLHRIYHSTYNGFPPYGLRHSAEDHVERFQVLLYTGSIPVCIYLSCYIPAIYLPYIYLYQMLYTLRYPVRGFERRYYTPSISVTIIPHPHINRKLHGATYPITGITMPNSLKYDGDKSAAQIQHLPALNEWRGY